jgi:diguanylate cyclase (GGDEF)-like protein
MRRSIFALFLIALAAPIASAQTSAGQGPTTPGAIAQPPPRTLTTVREVHTLSPDQARRSYPIHLRAVVTFYYYSSESHHSDLFLQDATGSSYAIVRNGPPTNTLPAGTLVDVTAVSGPGDFAPVLDQTHVTVAGTSHLPAYAKPVTFSDLLTGAYDSKWVQIEGIVRSVVESSDKVTLHVAMDGGTIAAITAKRPSVDYQHLVDTWARIRGDAGSIFNSNRQLTSARLFFPGLETVDAVASGPLNAFDLPVQPINGLLRYDPLARWRHRVHVRGTVTLDWPGRTICIRDSTDGLCAQADQESPVAVGSQIDLVGFTVLAGFRPGMVDAVFQPRPGRGDTTPVSTTPERALGGVYDSELVQIEGRLIGRDLTANDPVLVLSSGQLLFRVFLSAAESKSAISAIPIGSNLRVTGICAVEVNNETTVQGMGFTRVSRFWILLRSPGDILILQTPSRWTAERISTILLFTLAFTLAAIVWALALRRRVEQQTRELRESRELYRHMAHHDVLTGLPTRMLFSDRLQNALDRAQRFHTTIALLMLDLDRFKQINDCYGHQSGDVVLCVTAARLSAAIRKTDSIVRMGGDEFVILLNDLEDTAQAELIAAKIIAAVSEPIQLGDGAVAVTASIGVCALIGDDTTADAELLLKQVDAAMYGAKTRGRGRLHVFSDEPTQPVQSAPSEDHAVALIR